MTNTLIIDASMVYAANNAKLGHLKTQDGFSTGAIYGSVRMIEAGIKNFKIDQAFLVYDAGGSTRKRSEVDAGYKSGREGNLVAIWADADQQHRDHRSWFSDWAWERGISQCHAAGYEADDVIAWLHRYWRTEDPDGVVRIMTRDHDMMACLDDRTTMVWGKDVVAEMGTWKYPFSPSLYGMYLALAGDNTDAIRGVTTAQRASELCVDYENGQDFELSDEQEDLFLQNAKLAVMGCPHRPSIRPGNGSGIYDNVKDLFAEIEAPSLLKPYTDGKIIELEVNDVLDMETARGS
jgi:5'-3' exonuclease